MSQTEDFSKNSTDNVDFKDSSSIKVEETNANDDDIKPTVDKDKASLEAPEDRKIFIGGLTFDTGDTQLKEYFGKFGEVESANVKINPLTGR